MRKRELDELFPWDFIDVGVTKSFLGRWERAIRGEVAELREKCSACGAMCYQGGVCFEGRNQISKYGVMKFIGHLDVMRYFQKAMRRADVQSPLQRDSALI